MVYDIGLGHDKDSVKSGIALFIGVADDLHRRADAIAQWFATWHGDATALATFWAGGAKPTPEDVQEATELIAAADSFGALVPNALAADAKLGEWIARMRRIVF